MKRKHVTTAAIGDQVKSLHPRNHRVIISNEMQGRAKKFLEKLNYNLSFCLLEKDFKVNE